MKSDGHRPGGNSPTRLPAAPPVQDRNPSGGKTSGEIEAAIIRQALERSRADMQAFAYSVSHDLRAPLRAIQGFSKILLEDFSADLEGEAQQFLKHIIQNTQTLSGQLDDLLRFSRSGKSAPGKVPVDAGAFLRELVEQLRPSLPEGLGVTIGELPTISADPVLIRQAFAELIQNAGKFSSRVAGPKIEISGGVEENAAFIAIRDNGAGFDAAHAGKLFQVFQKLHSPAEFPGNGIGLAIVKRIVEAHGGCVDAQGNTGKGAVFTVMLPDAHTQMPLECSGRTPRLSPAAI